MRREAVSEIMLTLLLISMLTLTFNIQTVRAELETVRVPTGYLAVQAASDASDSWVWVRNTVTGAWGEAVVGTGDAICIARKLSFYRYRPADNSWMVQATPPNPDAGDAFKTGTALAWDFGDYIYALYGAATDDSRRWFYRYSISGNSWQALANTPYDQGEGDAITWVGLDSGIYATIGGEQRATYFLRYDPSTNSWSDAPADPPAGMGDGASLVWTGSNFLYALRGEFDETSPLYTFWRYSVTDDVWTTMADIPAYPHSGGVGGVGDGGSLLYIGLWLSNQTDFIYALSGNQASPEPIPDNRFYRYTISTDSWEGLADLSFGVGYYVGCRLGYADGHIYAWQGTPSTWAGGGDDLARYEFAPTPIPRTWTVDDDGPADFHTIQEAINAASPGDTIYICNGTYNENVVVNKTVSLIGENKYNTIIDGDGTGNVISVTTNNVNISGFTIRRLSWEGYVIDSGIYLDSVSGCNISANIITGTGHMGLGHGHGIWLYNLSSYNTLLDNTITKCRYGIEIYKSSHNILSDNTIASNWYGIDIESKDSKYNTLSSNHIKENALYGIRLYGTRFANNGIFHNNFINNTNQVYSMWSENIWDDGYPSGGNYWSDYEDRYPDAEELDGSGIWDTPYIIDANNRDRYPLMNPWGSQSPIADFTYSPKHPLIGETVSFNASASYDRDGSIASYEWNFGDGNVTTVADSVITHVYTAQDTYTVNLTVTDNDGLSHSTTKSITVIADSTPPTTLHDYDGLWHTTDFTITLTATDDISGVAETYYKINDGLTQNVSTNGQPFITTESANNTLEYWSVDIATNEETHHVLTGIKLDKTQPVANAGQNQTVNVGTTVTFDAGGSTDNVGITSYEWDFEDGTTGTGVTTTHTYTSAGTYTVTLTVKDAAGNYATDLITVTVLAAEGLPMWIIGATFLAIALGTAAAATILRKRRK